MNWPSLFISRLKALFREPASVFVFVLCLLAAVGAGWTSQQKLAGRTALVVINKDNGELGDRIEDMLIENQYVRVLYEKNEEKAYNMLLQGKIQCIATIPGDFTEKLRNREYRNIVELNVSNESFYYGAITEPLLKAVMKLWYEEHAVYRENEFLKEYGLEFTPEQDAALRSELEKIWNKDALITTVLEDPEKAEVAVARTPSVAVSWYCALLPFYLVICCLWMLQENYHGLLQRVSRRSFGPVGLLLSQSIAGLIPATAGFAIVALLYCREDFLYLLPYFIVYEIGCLGPALILCSVFRNLATLLLISPALTLSAAAISGLLVELPDWAGFWAILSRVFPGRHLFSAMSGEGSLIASVIVTAVWLAAGTAFSVIVKKRTSK